MQAIELGASEKIIKTKIDLLISRFNGGDNYLSVLSMPAEQAENESDISYFLLGVNELPDEISHAIYCGLTSIANSHKLGISYEISDHKGLQGVLLKYLYQG